MIVKRIHKILFNLILNNPVKSLFILLFLFGAYNIKNSDSQILVKKKLIHEFREGNRYYYTFYESGEMKIEGSLEPLKKVNGYVEIQEPQPWFVCSIFITIIMGLFIIVPFLVDDTDWNLEDVILGVLRGDIKSHKEYIGSDVFYYYTIDDKLLTTSKNEFLTSIGSSRLSEFYNSPNVFPEFEGTKQDIRDGKLSQIIGC